MVYQEVFNQIPIYASRSFQMSAMMNGVRRVLFFYQKPVIVKGQKCNDASPTLSQPQKLSA
jgi:hypothetical protein